MANSHWVSSGGTADSLLVFSPAEYSWTKRNSWTCGPSHFRPVSAHRRHDGLLSSHLTCLILREDLASFSKTRYVGLWANRNLAPHLHVKQPVFDFSLPTRRRLKSFAAIYLTETSRGMSPNKAKIEQMGLSGPRRGY
jgi:hypothetical protein